MMVYLLVVCSIFLVVFGLGAAFGKKHPSNTIGALMALVGLVTALIGTLLICVPGFFSC